MDRTAAWDLLCEFTAIAVFGSYLALILLIHLTIVCTGSSGPTMTVTGTTVQSNWRLQPTSIAGLAVYQADRGP